MSYKAQMTISADSEPPRVLNLAADLSSTVHGSVSQSASNTSRGVEVEYNLTNSSEVTTCSHRVLKDVSLGTVMTVCCVLTIVGNAMVLHAVRTDRKLQTVCRVTALTANVQYILTLLMLFMWFSTLS